MASALCTHRGSHKVSREQLASLPTPEGTDTHKPIPHIELVNGLHSVLQMRGFDIEREQYAVQRQGDWLFGVMDLKNRGPEGDYGVSLGFRTSNDKFMAVRMVAGVRVFVCDNLALSGDNIVLNRKHTANFDLLTELFKAVRRFETDNKALTENIEHMKSLMLSDHNAKELIYDLIVRKEAFPVKYILDVDREYFTPSYPEFTEMPHSAWRLNNAFTTVAKVLKPMGQMAALSKVGDAFSQLMAL